MAEIVRIVKYSNDKVKCYCDKYKTILLDIFVKKKYISFLYNGPSISHVNTIRLTFACMS